MNPFNISKQNSPSPTSYNIPSLFNPDNTTSTFSVHRRGKKSFCFGAGRENFNKTVVNRDKIYSDPDNPGPGYYDDLKPLGTDSVSFKLKYKLDINDYAKIALKRGIPGVGTYEDIGQLDKQGKYISSQFSNSKSQRWAQEEKLKPSGLTTQKNPGPGRYEHKGNVAQAYQTISNFSTVKARTFGKVGRPEWYSRFQTPGPGTYKPPSNFKSENLYQDLQNINMAIQTQQIYSQKIPNFMHKRKQSQIQSKLVFSPQHLYYDEQKKEKFNTENNEIEEEQKQGLMQIQEENNKILKPKKQLKKLEIKKQIQESREQILSEKCVNPNGQIGNNSEIETNTHTQKYQKTQYPLQSLKSHQLRNFNNSEKGEQNIQSPLIFSDNQNEAEKNIEKIQEQMFSAKQLKGLKLKQTTIEEKLRIRNNKSMVSRIKNRGFISPEQNTSIESQNQKEESEQ